MGGITSYLHIVILAYMKERQVFLQSVPMNSVAVNYHVSRLYLIRSSKCISLYTEINFVPKKENLWGGYFIVFLLE